MMLINTSYMVNIYNCIDVRIYNAPVQVKFISGSNRRSPNPNATILVSDQSIMVCRISRVSKARV